MASPLPSEDVEPTFLPFFGMKRAPFFRLSAPTEIFHSDQSALLNSHLTAAKARADSLVVIFGADGIGKTTLLNEYMAGLADDLCYAAFDETCVEGIQFYRSFLEQIGFGEIVGTLHELQHITAEYLVHRAKTGEHALIFVDNAHLVRPAVLEQLRLMADTKIDYARVLSMVLAGNLNFQRIMDSPAMRSLKFQRQTSFHIRAYSEIETDDYIRHRMNLAGAADAAQFSDESRALIYRFTGGNPSMINSLCNAVFAESCTQGSRVISEHRIRAVAEARKMLPHVVPIRGKGRRKNDPEPLPLVPDPGSSERITGRQPDAALPGSESSRPSLLHDVEIKDLLVRVAELSSQLERKASEEKRLALMIARKHDKDAGELRAQLAAQVELAANHSRALDDRAEDIGRLNAALMDREQLRRDAERSSQALADKLGMLHGKLDSSHKEVETLTARQKKYDERINGLTQALAESRSVLTERDRAIEKLAADLDNLDSSGSDEVIADLRSQFAAQAGELNGLLTTVASSAAEIVNLKEALTASRKVARDVAGERKKLRRTTRRPSKMLGIAKERIDALEKLLEKARKEQATPGNAPEKPEALEEPVVSKDRPVTEARAGHEAGITGTSETKTLLPDQMTTVSTAEHTTVTAHGGGDSIIELFRDGKALRVMGLGGGPARMMIGRAEDCDLRLDSKYVSRHHAILVNMEGCVAIEDLRSSNGIFVNSKKVDHADLRPGDTVAIGNFRLRLKRS